MWPRNFPTRFRHAAIRCLLTIGIGLFSLQASAWNATGHREVVAVAWSMSNPQTRQAVHRLLEHQTSITSTRGLQGESAWMAAALWPDDLRDQAESSSDLAPPTHMRQWEERARTGLATRRWHFADRDIARPFHGQPVQGLLEPALKVQLDLLADPKATNEARAVALAWVSHLVADAHQPLHTASRADPLRPGQLDAGGNLVTVLDGGRKPPDPLSLHRWWDELPGHARPGKARFDTEVARLTRQAQQVSVDDIKSPRGWIEESFMIARDHVYPGLAPDPDHADTFLIRQDYWLEGRDITRQRLALAGRRLAQVVEQALRDLR